LLTYLDTYPVTAPDPHGALLLQLPKDFHLGTQPGEGLGKKAR